MADNKPIGFVVNEEAAVDVEFKVKGEDKGGFLEAEGIVQDAKPNRNRRLYRLEELIKAYSSPRVKELVESGNFKGEAGHPIDQSIARQSKVDPRYEQVWYKKLWIDGDTVKAIFSGTSNDLGRSFNEDLRRGQHPSFSIRAIGSLINENGLGVVRNMTLVAIDRVYFPSHSRAYTTRVLTTESAGSNVIRQYDINKDNYFYAQRNAIQKLAEAGNSVDMSEEILVPLTQAEVANYLVQESGNIQTAISTFDVLYESIQLDPSLNTVTMKTRMGDTFHICLEDAVKREVLDGISRYF